MIEHFWTVLCSKSIVDEEANSISLIEVLEELTVQLAPGHPEGVITVPVVLEVVSFWGREEEDQATRGRGRVTILSPSGTSLSETEYEIDLTVFFRTRARVKIQGFPVDQPGQYRFRVEWRNSVGSEWKLGANVPIRVFRTDQQAT